MVEPLTADGLTSKPVWEYSRRNSGKQDLIYRKSGRFQPLTKKEHVNTLFLNLPVGKIIIFVIVSQTVTCIRITRGLVGYSGTRAAAQRRSALSTRTRP